MTSPPHPPERRAGERVDPPATQVAFDAASMSTREINRSLQALPRGRAVVSNPAGRHNLAVGLDAPVRVEIDGPAGDYAGGLGKKAVVTVRGSAGRGAGENLMSGCVHVRGSAGPSAGSSARGGTVVVDDGCGARAGVSLKGGTLVIGGDAGPLCGFLAQSGVILVGGDAGRHLGDSLYEAVVYVGGRIAGLGSDAIMEEINEHDVTFVKILADGYGLDHISPENISKVVSTRRLYHLDGHVDGAY